MSAIILLVIAAVLIGLIFGGKSERHYKGGSYDELPDEIPSDKILAKERWGSEEDRMNRREVQILP